MHLHILRDKNYERILCLMCCKINGGLLYNWWHLGAENTLTRQSQILCHSSFYTLCTGPDQKATKTILNFNRTYVNSNLHLPPHYHILFWVLTSGNYPILSLLTYLLTSWALLEEPLIRQPLKNFPEFYGTRRINTVFTRSLHRSLSWAISIQSTPSHPISQRSILILSPTYVLVFPVNSFLLAFALISYKHSSCPPFVLHAPPISSFLTWSI
jgi:hypothetical protein